MNSVGFRATGYSAQLRSSVLVYLFIRHACSPLPLEGHIIQPPFKICFLVCFCACVCVCVSAFLCVYVHAESFFCVCVLWHVDLEMCVCMCARLCVCVCARVCYLHVYLICAPTFSYLSINHFHGPHHGLVPLSVTHPPYQDSPQ